jgi:hypothetical protein
MIKISNEDAARDPDSILSMINSIGLKVIYNEENNAFYFPTLDDKIFENDENFDFKVQEIKTSYIDYEINEDCFHNIHSMLLDHKEIGYDLQTLMEQINQVISHLDLKLIDIDTQSDYMQAFITKKSAKTPKEMISAAFDIQNIDFDPDKFFVPCNNPDKSNNEMEIEDALRYILKNADIQNETVDYELLKSFLEDTAPEFKYDLHERNGKTFISINEFEDD